MGETLGSAECGDGVVEVSGEGVANVEVGVSVLCFFVVGVLRNIGQQAGLIVERMRPGVGELRGESVPALGLEGGLKRVVDGAQVAAGFVDDAEGWELTVVGTSRGVGRLGGVGQCGVDIE